ncbi:MAG: hypothetical protein ACRD1G_12785 [Acidimicrobiales bacterium]
MSLLLPRTDAAVLVELVVVIVVVGTALGFWWGRPDVRLLVIGIGLLLLGLMGLRALH